MAKVYIVFRDNEPYMGFLTWEDRDREMDKFIIEDREQEHTWSTMTIDLHKVDDGLDPVSG